MSIPCTFFSCPRAQKDRNIGTDELFCSVKNLAFIGKWCHQMEKSSKSPQEHRKWGFTSMIVVVLLASLVSVASALTFWKYFHGFHPRKSHHDVIIDGKYKNALTVALGFFDVQKCIISFFFSPHYAFHLDINCC